MSEYAGQDNGSLRVTIREAAHRLGVTEAAIRKRIQSGSLDRELGSDGRAYVYLDLSKDMSHPEPQVHRDPLGEELVEELRDRVAYLERQVEEERDTRRRADTLLAQLMQRIPELEAPSSPTRPEPTEPAEPSEPERVEPWPNTGGAQEGSDRPRDTAEFPVGGSLTRPWWRRVFGG